MQVWAVTFDVRAVATLNESYDRALALVDHESQQRIQRYYHQVDRFRGLIGRLLPRVLLKERGVPPHRMAFSITETGKPFITTDHLSHPIGYSITHDSGVIAMAFASGVDLHPDPPAYRVGVDIMRLQLPKRETFAGFVDIVGDQLTASERELLLPSPPSPPLPPSEALRRFYLIWTLKESFTKALGMGLGFEFRRIEYDVVQDIVRIDGVVPRGWEFIRFEVENKLGDGQDSEMYVGVSARYVGEDGQQQEECRVRSPDVRSWLKVYDATEFIQRAIEELSVE
ncbi:hypothetical protein BKA93DRAFT_772305 [Sparassis latifolia]